MLTIYDIGEFLSSYRCVNSIPLNFNTPNPDFKEIKLIILTFKASVITNKIIG